MAEVYVTLNPTVLLALTAGGKSSQNEASVRGLVCTTGDNRLVEAGLRRILRTILGISECLCLVA